jgi:(1->4)-alpha-D-glucan 1-alpha-D-glucosylmutase
VHALLGRLESNPFLDDLGVLARPVAWFGMLNSLSMTLLKLTSPGVPDFYQGNEIFDLSLVDPDNRRPVDYGHRKALFEELQRIASDPAETMAARVRALFDAPYDGRAKLWLAWRALQLRRVHERLFLEGDYHPVATSGERSRHVVSFARRLADSGIVVAAGRLFACMGLESGTLPVGEPAWGDSALDLAFLPQGSRLVNVLTGVSIEMDASRRLTLSRAMTHFPAALLAYGLRDGSPNRDPA